MLKHLRRIHHWPGGRPKPTAELPVFVYPHWQIDNNLHQHPFIEMVIVTCGAGLHRTTAGSYPIGAGDVFVVDPGVGHAYDSTRDLEIINVLVAPLEQWFPAADLENRFGFIALFCVEPALRAEHSFRSRLRLKPVDLEAAIGLLEPVACERILARKASHIDAVIAFMQLTRLLVRAYETTRASAVRETMRLSRLLAKIRTHCDTQFTVASMAADAAMSRSSLLRAFQAAVGMAPMEYVNRQRMRRARVLLREQPDWGVTRIALDIGFNDGSYFARVFQRVHGCSPSSWRARNQVLDQKYRTSH